MNLIYQTNTKDTKFLKRPLPKSYITENESKLLSFQNLNSVKYKS